MLAFFVFMYGNGVGLLCVGFCLFSGYVTLVIKEEHFREVQTERETVKNYLFRHSDAAADQKLSIGRTSGGGAARFVRIRTRRKAFLRREEEK